MTMSESEAWSYLAGVWTAAYRARRSVAHGPGGRPWYGLCAGVTFLQWQGRISRHTYRVMLRTLKDMALRAGRRDMFAWPKSIKGARARALFCRQMADAAARRTPRRTAGTEAA